MTTAPDPRVLGSQRRGKTLALAAQLADALIAHVRDLRDQADALLESSYDDLDCQAAARVLHELRMARKSLQASEDFLVKQIDDTWRGDRRTPMVVDGVGSVRVMRGKDRKAWEHEALLHDVIQAHIEDSGGEIPDPFTVGRWIHEAVGFTYWRVSALSLLGISADEYCETSPGRTSVNISTDDQIGGTHD